MESREIINKSLCKTEYFFYRTIFFIGLSAFSIFLFYNSFENKYFDFPVLMFAILTLTVSFYFLISMFFFKKYILYKDSIIVYYNGLFFLKKEFYYNEFESFSIESRKDGYNDIDTELIIFLFKNNFSLLKDNIENYEELKDYLIKKRRLKNVSLNKAYKKNKLSNKIGFVFFLFSSLLFVFIYYNFFLTEYKDIKETDLITIKSRLINKPEIVKGNRYTSTHIDIILEGYEPFTFELVNTNYSASYVKGLISNVSKGNSIEIDVLKDDFDKKIKESKPMSFLDKHLGYKTILPLGIRANETSYLSLKDYNESKKTNDKENGIAIIVIFLICSGIAAYQYYKITK